MRAIKSTLWLVIVPTAMTTFSSSFRLLPILWPLLSFVTILTPYIIAVSLSHVYPFLPSISKTAAFEPEGSIFGFLMTLVAFFGVLVASCRYFQLDGFQSDFEKDTLHKIKWFNKLALPFGFSCILGVVMVANFRSPLDKDNSAIGGMHDAGTVLLLLSGILYYWFQTIISYHAVKVSLNTKCTFFFRLAVTCILTFTGMGYPFFKWFSYTLFKGSNSSIKVAYWQPKNGGYALHVINCAGEWIACLSLAIFSVSFYKEFQDCSIEVRYVENDEFKDRKKIDYSKLIQSKEDE